MYTAAIIRIINYDNAYNINIYKMIVMFFMTIKMIIMKECSHQMQTNLNTKIKIL
jgi:hypothetical protein